MYKIAVLGDYDSILGFKAIGLDVFPSDDAEEIKMLIRRLASENYAIIYITEQAATLVSDEISRYKDKVTPAIILIPGMEGSLGIGKAAVKSRVERAVGADIISGR